MTKNEKRLAFGLVVMFAVIIWLLFRDTKPMRQALQAVKDAFNLPSIDMSLPDIPERNRQIPSLNLSGKVKGNTCSLCMTKGKADKPAGIPLKPNRVMIGIGATESAIEKTQWNNMSGNPPSYFPVY